MANVRVRRAEKKDIFMIDELLNQVLAVHHNGRPDLFKSDTRKYTDEQLELLLEDNSRPIFVAVDSKNQVVGYAFCVLIEHIGHNILTDIKTLYIDDLCVDEKNRGQKIGRTLYEYVKEYAKEQGCYNLTLNVWACNESAMAFYENCGLNMLKKEMEVILA